MEYIRKQDALKGKRTATIANGICFEAKACVPVEYIESLEPADVVPAADVIPVEWIIKQIQEQSLAESKAFSKLLRLWEREKE